MREERLISDISTMKLVLADEKLSSWSLDATDTERERERSEFVTNLFVGWAGPIHWRTDAIHLSPLHVESQANFPKDLAQSEPRLIHGPIQKVLGPNRFTLTHTSPHTFLKPQVNVVVGTKESTPWPSGPITYMHGSAYQIMSLEFRYDLVIC